MRYRWRLPAEIPEEIEAIRNLSQAINVPESIAQILVSRGIRSFEEAKEFFRPSLDQLFPPSLMHDMGRATERIVHAISTGERIAVYGDYDVDGTTSTAMMTLFLRSIGAKVAYHIPDRFTEGYGLTVVSLDRLFSSSPEGKPDLLISIDCGITAVDAIAYARDTGVDVIVCDHHEPSDTIPNANAILNPLKPGDTYPYKHLCGCGVAFKLIQSLAEHYNVTEKAYQYLDFVSIASSADIVSLRGENRVLAFYGLKLINETPRPGIKALIEAAGLKHGKIGTTNIVYGLAPRINAAGRLGDGSRAVELFMAQTDDEAKRIASILDNENSNRRLIDEEAFLDACKTVDGYLDRDRDRIIVLHNGAWHAGVIGIVASRVAEKYHLPVVLMTTIDGIAKGSARSIGGFDIHSALKQCERLLVTFGGHKFAAGVSMQVGNVDEFRSAINSVAREMITPDMLTPEIRVDAVININELTPRYFAIVRQLAPFGPDNFRPNFYAKDIQAVGYPRTVGKATSTHLKMNVRPNIFSLTNGSDPSANGSANNVSYTMGGSTLDAIGFSMGSRIKEVTKKDGKLRDDMEFVFMLDENEYNGRITPQLVIKDMK